ncbi:MAG: LptA/OstA family protein [Gammaproteobacteria bacterium]|nr:LptA/OstA family protein [Gammaproteobacteria bacterium]
MPVAVVAVLHGLTPALAQQAPEPDIVEGEAKCDTDFELDFRNDLYVCPGVRISDGSVTVRADRGMTNNIDSDTTEWRFVGNVRIALDSAELLADSARFQLEAGEFVFGELTGTPVTISDYIDERELEVRGSADTLSYDRRERTLRMLGQVTLGVGSDQLTGCDWIYNLDRQTVSNGTSDCGLSIRATQRENADTREPRPDSP